MEVAISNAAPVQAGTGGQAADAGPESLLEVELARRVAGGDMAALAEVYRRFRSIVYTLCLRMTRNVAEAEDLSQEVFVNLHRNLESYRGEAALSTWIHRVTVNRVLMHFRKGVFRYEQLTEDGGPPPERVTHFS